MNNSELTGLLTIKLGTPNKNGRIYTKEIMQKAFEDLIEEQRLLYIVKDESFISNYCNIDMQGIVGLATLNKIDNENIFIDCKFFDSEVINLFDKGFVPALLGEGNLICDQKGYLYVDDYHLTALFLTATPSDETLFTFK